MVYSVFPPVVSEIPKRCFGMVFVGERSLLSGLNLGCSSESSSGKLQVQAPKQPGVLPGRRGEEAKTCGDVAEAAQRGPGSVSAPTRVWGCGRRDAAGRRDGPAGGAEVCS